MAARGRVAPSIWVLTAGEKYEGRGGLSSFEGGFLGQMKSGGSVADSVFGEASVRSHHLVEGGDAVSWFELDHV